MTADINAHDYVSRKFVCVQCATEESEAAGWRRRLSMPVALAEVLVRWVAASRLTPAIADKAL